jgi:hypothetical protein
MEQEQDMSAQEQSVCKVSVRGDSVGGRKPRVHRWQRTNPVSPRK